MKKIPSKQIYNLISMVQYVSWIAKHLTIIQWGKHSYHVDELINDPLHGSLYIIR